MRWQGTQITVASISKRDRDLKGVANMNPRQLAQLVIDHADRVKAKQPNEDSLVELKSKFVEPREIARSIAGHANAARGQRILWIIGLDEDAGVIGADMTELANWYPQLRAEFDGAAPELVFDKCVANVDDRTLVALLFDTTLAPYVIKNPKRGEAKSGPIDLEVPWRQGRRTMSAKQEHILRILTPLEFTPNYEVAGCTFKPDTHLESVKQKMHVLADIYVSPSSSDRSIIIPMRGCRVDLRVKGSDLIVPMSLRRIIPSAHPLLNWDSKTVVESAYETIVKGSGMITVWASIESSKSPPPETTLEVLIAITAINSNEARLPPIELVSAGPPRIGMWGTDWIMKS